MARRAALYQNVRKNHENVFVLDAGNLFGHRKPAEQKQTDFLCEETAKLGYDVFGVGQNDLNYGLDYLRGVEKKYGWTFTSANLRVDGGDLLFEPYVLRDWAGLRVGIISVISERYQIVTMTASVDDYVADPPKEALEKYLPELREKADLIILLAQLPSTETRQLLMDLGPGSGIDVCIEGRDPRQYRRINKVNGDVILLAANNEGKYIGQLDMVVDGAGNVADATVTVHALDNGSPEVEDIRKRVDAFKAENQPKVAKLEPFAHSRGNGSASEKFLGVHSCARCHTDAARTYAKSGHARAFQTLIAKGQERNPECVSCHVVGFDWINGYDQVPDPNLPGRDALKNVQCEACHGYGTQHSRDGSWLAAAKSSCTVCHDSANSPNFDYETYWAKIAH